jgi:phosphohistidine phosphatase SixA
MSNVSPRQKDSWHGGVPEANIERMLELAKMPEAWGKESVMVVAKEPTMENRKSSFAASSSI